MTRIVVGIGELCEFVKGASIPRARLSLDGDWDYLHYGDLYRGHNLYVDWEFPESAIPAVSSREKISKSQFLQNDDIVYILTSETVEDLGKALLVKNLEAKRAVAGTETTIMRVRRKDLVIPSYLNYLLQTALFKKILRQYVTGMKVFRVHPRDISRIEISLPSLEEQSKIVSILDGFHIKMRLNSRINDYLLELSTALFEEALEESSTMVALGGVVEVEDSKRVPLNSREREQRKGPYPYYGATSVMDFVDDYLFDGTRVLLGEDGTVIQENGKPILQYVWGKYWVNNHAHILKASSVYSLEIIYTALAGTDIRHIVTGAVQMKISQKNLKGLKLSLPDPRNLMPLDNLFREYKNLVDESKQLELLRDALLPKLMSGEIDVSQVDITQLNNHLCDC